MHTPSSSTTKQKRTPASRLLQELTTNAKEVDSSIWERLGPAGNGDDLLLWEAVLKGVGLVDYGNADSRERGNWQRGYEGGKWILEIRIPETYPIKAPVVRFVTRMCHPNVDFQTGAICLSLLSESWTPAYTIHTTLEAIRQMIREGGEVDSPLNVDLAALLRGGDSMGAEGLVRFFTEREMSSIQPRPQVMG